YKQSLSRGNLTYRCIKLGTTEAPLRLRLVDDHTLRPPVGLSVMVHRFNFEGKEEEQQATDADGLLVTTKAYPHVAFVHVRSGGSVLARIPIEVFDGKTVICPISMEAESDARAQLELRRRQWLGQLYESLLVVDDQFKQLNQLIEGKKHEQALTQ